jgi:hypothetical protein
MSRMGNECSSISLCLAKRVIETLNDVERANFYFSAHCQAIVKIILLDYTLFEKVESTDSPKTNDNNAILT